jgi:hypothetical protein
MTTGYFIAVCPPVSGSYFGKRVSVPKLVESCRYTKRHGVFAVSLGAALKTYGLSVSFHSEPDTNISGFERRCYVYARRLGIVAQAALDLSQVLRQAKGGNIPIVLFNTPANDGHFSPLLGSRNGTLRLPLADGGKMAEGTFIARWSDPDILRQCVIVGAAKPTTTKVQWGVMTLVCTDSGWIRVDK